MKSIHWSWGEPITTAIDDVVTAARVITHVVTPTGAV